MTNIHVTFTTSPAVADIDFLTRKINEETPDFGTASSFACFIKDEAGTIIAGCNGSVIYGCIYTDQLWVNKNHRKSGYATELMSAVHEYGKQLGCSMATVSTMSFQNADEFYQKLGYVVDFSRPGYNKNSKALFLRKEL